MSRIISISGDIEVILSRIREKEGCSWNRAIEILSKEQKSLNERINEKTEEVTNMVEDRWWGDTIKPVIVTTALIDFRESSAKLRNAIHRATKTDHDRASEDLLDILSLDEDQGDELPEQLRPRYGEHLEGS